MATKVSNISADSRLYPRDIALNGKYISSVDGVLIGPEDFQVLQNMRYTDTNPKSIAGMTKINTDAITTVTDIKDIYQIYKEQYNENHLVVQSYDSGKTKFHISEMTQAIPSTGNFSATPIKILGTTWVAATAKIVGDKVFPTVTNGCYYECVIAGTTHANTQPTWSTTENSLKTDGTVTWITRTGDLYGTFATSPNGNLVFCNGRNNYIYGGNENDIGALLSINPNISTDIKDYTEQINNVYADSDNVVVIPTNGGGIDAYTSACYQFEQTGGATDHLTDTSGNTHTLTNAGCSFTTDSSKLLMGSYSLLCGVSYVSRDITADAHFDLSAGIWSITTKCRVESLAASRSLWGMSKDANNYVACYIDTNGAVHVSVIVAAGEVLGTVGLVTDNNTIIVDQKQTIEVARDVSNNWYIFVDGNLKATMVDANDLANDYVTLYIGNSEPIGTFLGTLDEWKLDNGICRHTLDYIPKSSAFTSSGECNLYFGNSFAIDKIKLYVMVANTTTATATVYYWNGAWTACTNIVDGTSVGGDSLAQTGTITFDATDHLVKPKILNSNMAYWYKLVVSGLDDTTSIYHATNSFNMQEIKDNWDGNELNVASSMIYLTSYADNTVNLLVRDYDSLDDGTYSNLGALTSSQYFILGFKRRITAARFEFIDTNVNTTAATALTVYYWDGDAWTTVGTITDGTSNGNISFAQSGIVSWERIDNSKEIQYTPNNGTLLYYYKFVFDKTLSADVFLDMASGIPTLELIKGYNVPILWLDALFLCGEKYGERNKIIGSEPSTDSTFNGVYSSYKYIGDTSEIIAGCTLYARYSSELHESLILLKRNSAWLLDGTSIDNVTSYRLSDTFGISAKDTLKVCDLGYEVAPGINKAVAIWQTNSSMVMFDNNSIIDIGGDISNIFTDMYNTGKTDRINPTYLQKSTGFFDPTYNEYHWLYHSGTSTSIDSEMVFDIKRKKWYKIVRTKKLKCGTHVSDTNGSKYTYGALSTGFIERLEYGNTFDGDSIVSILRTGDKPLGETIEYEERLRYIKIVGKVTGSSATVSVTHHKDGSTTGTALQSITQSSTGNGFYQHRDAPNKSGVFHSITMSCTSSDSQSAFEPLVISLLKKSSRNDI